MNNHPQEERKKKEKKDEEEDGGRKRIWTCSVEIKKRIEKCRGMYQTTEGAVTQNPVH